MSIKLNSVEFVLQEGWRDAANVAEITQDLLDGYESRIAITNLMNQFLIAPLTPEEQGHKLVWVSSTRQVIDLTHNDEISCFSCLIHKIKMLFSSEYAASMEKAAADIVKVYTTYYSQACDDRRKEMAGLKERHAYFSGGAEAAQLESKAETVHKEWLDLASKQGRLKDAKKELEGYWGILDPSPAQQLYIDRFVQISGCSIDDAKDWSKRDEIVKQGEKDFNAKKSAYQQADSAYLKQKRKAEQAGIDKGIQIPLIQAEMDRLQQRAAAVGFQF